MPEGWRSGRQHALPETPAGIRRDSAIRDMRHASFPFVARPDAVVLILGSLPGAESLARGEYYANRANRFWWIMGELVGAYPDLPYAARLERLRDSRIALWDVCASAERAGSLDANIVAAEPNDFATFLEGHPDVRLIGFNGGYATTLFTRSVKVPAFIRTERLPSTSPAHAGMRPDAKLARWRAALGAFIG